MDELLKAIATANLDRKILLLPQLLEYGESGIELLISYLGDRELAIREKAYQLLKNIKHEQAQKETKAGLLLNPGAKIYSVYKALIWFTDESYLLFDGVDYFQEIKSEVYGKRQYEEEEYWNKDKRIYCYLDKSKAEEKAEVIHRNLISQYGISDIGGFYWERENPDFDLKSWCLENNRNYLIKIISDRNSKPKQKLKAYELLHDFDTDAAKQAIAEGIEEISVESIFDLGEEIDLNSIRLSWDGNPH